MITHLIQYLDKCNKFNNTLFLLKDISFELLESLVLTMIDETYCLISLIVHLLVANKQSTNYI